MFKTNSEIIKIEARSQAEIRTGVTFWSHDRGTAKLIFKLIKDGAPQSIPEGTAVPIRLIFKSKTAQDGFGKHDYLATVEDRINGIVSIVLEDNILGYIGEVKGSIYLDLPGNRSLDTAGRFNFSIQRSPIDDSTPELEDYYFNGFSKTIDKIEEMISQAENRIDGKVDKVESKLGVLEGKVDQSQGTLDRIEDEIKESAGMTEKFINSIDFGDYDYSGNPNLMNNLSFSDFAVQAGGGTISDGGNFLKINKVSGANLFVMAGYKNSTYYLTPVLSNTTYTITYTLRKSSNFVSQSGKRVIVRYRLNQNTTTNNLGELILDSTNLAEEFTTYTKTFTTGSLVNPNSYYFQILVEEGLSGEIELSYEIKLEEGSTATPYQPNLLNNPYYLSNVDLGMNIAQTTNLPVTTSNQLITEQKLSSYLIKGETYTVTLEGTKPANQDFRIFIAQDNGNRNMADMKPIVGSINQWEATFTYNIDNTNAGSKLIRIYQRYSELGSCTIKWLKIEKGDTRTPNIDRLRYKGIGVTKNSINKYLWEENTLLEKAYINSIDFGDYDYSGNPNLMTVLKAGDFLTQSGATIEDFNGGLKVTFTKTDGATFLESKKNIPALLPNKQYTLSADVTISDGYTGKLDNLRLGYRKFPNGTIILPLTAKNAQVGKKTKIFITANSSSETDPSIFGRMYFTINTTSTEPFIGTVLIENIKVEEGTTATPYQPNLLDAPYYLSKVALGENIADPAVNFPIKSSVYNVYTGDMEEDLMIGQTYTITLKGTKPATQTFMAFNRWEINLGTLKPVEGLTDVWSLTFTPTKLEPNFPKNLRIYQYPEATAGSCQIDWLKIEKGGTRTPNIPCYKYRGVNNFVSKNPKDYIWDINNDYAQQIFDDTVSLTKPQTIISAKNFEEVPTVKNQPIHYGPQLFEGWYGSGTEHAGMGTKARLRVGGLVVDGRDQLSEPFDWNSGRYEATVNRDITFYCKGTMFVEMGGNIGKYIYIANWKNSEQTQYASGMPAGAGTNLDGGLYYRNMLDFSWIVQLRQGDKFSIGIELADGKTVSKIQIRTLHIKELVSPTN